MRFIVDAQLPPALARAIAAQGYQAEHVTDVAPGDSPDSWIWDYAIANESVIITKDSDFPDLAVLMPVSPSVVWIRVGNTRKQELLDWFIPKLDSVITLLNSGPGIVEMR